LRFVVQQLVTLRYSDTMLGRDRPV
jgi:hypothetical protein